MSIDFQIPSTHFSFMEREIDWIKRALDQNKDKTQTGLAQALGIDKSAVSRLLRGARRLKFAEARLAAAYLEVTPPSGFSEDAEGYQAEPHPDGPSQAPLYRAWSDKNGFWAIDFQDVVERRPRPYSLSGTTTAFGFYVPDEAMTPRFRIGELAWINPAKPPIIGEDILLISAQDAKRSPCVLLCELVERENDAWRVKQYRNNKLRNFAKKDWQGLHVLSRS